MSITTKVMEQHLVPNDAMFYADPQHHECPICGISSFSHFHKRGTLPREFERRPEPQVDDEWREELRDIAGVSGQYTISDIIQGTVIVVSITRIKDFIRKTVDRQRKLAYDQGFREGVDTAAQ